MVGLPTCLAIYAGLNKDCGLFEDGVYIGTSVIEAFAVSYGSKILIDRKRPFEKYPDRVDEQECPGDPSFPSIHTASAFSLATSLSIKYPKWYVIAPSA